jgi:hypothetical protein
MFASRSTSSGSQTASVRLALIGFGSTSRYASASWTVTPYEFPGEGISCSSAAGATPSLARRPSALPMPMITSRDAARARCSVASRRSASRPASARPEPVDRAQRRAQVGTGACFRCASIAKRISQGPGCVSE